MPCRPRKHKSLPFLGIALVPASVSNDWKALNKAKQLFYVGTQGELNKLCSCFWISRKHLHPCPVAGIFRQVPTWTRADPCAGWRQVSLRAAKGKCTLYFVYLAPRAMAIGCLVPSLNLPKSSLWLNGFHFCSSPGYDYKVMKVLKVCKWAEVANEHSRVPCMKHWCLKPVQLLRGFAALIRPWWSWTSWVALSWPCRLRWDRAEVLTSEPGTGIARLIRTMRFS